MNKTSIAFSSCPNDTFIFHAMLHSLVDCRGHTFEPYISDVEELNSFAFDSRFHVTKMSYHAYLHLKDRYQLLDSGSALGFGCGPLLVKGDSGKDIKDMKVAVPGKLTTAFMLMRLWDPEIKNVEFTRFDNIMPGVRDGIYDAGLIIHEGRFVYPTYGLKKIVDLGEWWEKKTGMPIPLGCIAALKSMGEKFAEDISSVIRSSVEYAFSNRAASASYIKSLAQEMDDAVVNEHIRLYVNDFSVSLGEKGRDAVKLLERMAVEKGII